MKYYNRHISSFIAYVHTRVRFPSITRVLQSNYPGWRIWSYLFPPKSPVPNGYFCQKFDTPVLYPGPTESSVIVCGTVRIGAVNYSTGPCISSGPSVPVPVGPNTVQGQPYLTGCKVFFLTTSQTNQRY